MCGIYGFGSLLQDFLKKQGHQRPSGDNLKGFGKVYHAAAADIVSFPFSLVTGKLCDSSYGNGDPCAHMIPGDLSSLLDELKRSGLSQVEVGYSSFMSCYKLIQFGSRFTALFQHSGGLHTFRLIQSKVGCLELNGVFQAEWVFSSLFGLFGVIGVLQA
jgi:hypothetical protein